MQRWDYISQWLASFSVHTKQQLDPFIRRLRSSDTRGEISRLAAITRMSIRGQSLLTNDEADLIDTAHIYAWLAYSLYDEIVDEHKPLYTFLANICYKERLRLIYKTSVAMTDELDLFMATDFANHHELQIRHAALSYPASQALRNNYLKNRAIGHLFPIRSMIINSSLHATHQLQLIQAAEEYIVAKQLLDDLHDWRDDFIKRRPSSVTTDIAQRSNLADATNQVHYRIAPQRIDEIEKLVQSCLQTCQRLIPDSSLTKLFANLTPVISTTRQQLQKLSAQSIS